MPVHKKTLRLDADLHLALKLLATTKRMPLEQLADDILRRYILSAKKRAGKG